MRKQTFFLLSILFHLLLLLLLAHTSLDPVLTTFLQPPPPLEVTLVPAPAGKDPLVAPPLAPPAAVNPQVSPTAALSPQNTPSPVPEDIPVIIRPFTLDGGGDGTDSESGGKSGITGIPEPAGGAPPVGGDLPENNSSSADREYLPSAPSREDLFAMGRALNKSLSRPDRLRAPDPGDSRRFSSATFGYPAGGFRPGSRRGGSGSGDGKTATAGGAVFNSHGYDITPWARRVVYRIKKNWLIPATADLGIRGEVIIYAVIQKGGDIARIELRSPSVVTEFNKSALGAIQNSAPFPFLPDDFPYPSVDGLIIFRFN